MNKLEIIAHKDAAGQPTVNAIKVSTKNPEWGTVLVMTTKVSVKDGLINESKRVGAFRAKLSTLNALGLVLGGDFNAALTKLDAKPHTIAVKETLAPQFAGHTPKMNPTTKEVVKNSLGQPIYYNAIVVEDGVQDIFEPLIVAAKVAPAKTAEKDLATA